MAPGPYPYPPHQPQPQMMPAPVYSPPQQTDSKAIISLVLGLTSLICCLGILTGIPAMVLGAMSKRDISRSGGTLGGDGLAIGGMVTGGLSTVGTIAYIILNVALFTAMGTSPTYAPTPYVPPPTYTTPLASGAIHTTELTHTGGALKQQLIGEANAAKTAGEKVLVYVYLRGAKACTEFDATLSDYDMQRVLAHVRLVRVEATELPSDLSALGMAKATYPWFYKIDTKPLASGTSDLLIVDSISGDEWSDNYAYNISPVLEQFMNGTYIKKVPPALPSTTPLTKPKPIVITPKVESGF